jgi:hypothetical protein
VEIFLYSFFFFFIIYLFITYYYLFYFILFCPLDSENRSFLPLELTVPTKYWTNVATKVNYIKKGMWPLVIMKLLGMFGKDGQVKIF